MIFNGLPRNLWKKTQSMIIEWTYFMSLLDFLCKNIWDYITNFFLMFSGQKWNKSVYCTISTNSLVTGHKALQREKFVLLSQVTFSSEDCDTPFSGLFQPKFVLNGNSEEKFCLVTPPDSGWGVAYLFVVVTGHKPRRVGRNGTVSKNSQYISSGKLQIS